MMIKKILSFIVLLLITFFWLFGVTSCSPINQASRKLERANKLIRKAKYLDPSISIVDTVILSKNVYIERIKKDTMFVDRGDTVTIENDRLIIRYKRDTVTNIVTLEGECKADTVLVKVPCLQETLIQREVLKWWQNALYYLGIITSILLAMWGLSKFVKPF